MIRFCDIVFSAIGLLLLSPLFLIVYILIRCESKGGGFYRQQRVGKDGRMFGLYKFRSMRTGSDKKGLITVGGHDARITRMGYFIRKYKIDELPQLRTNTFMLMFICYLLMLIRLYVKSFAALIR